MGITISGENNNDRILATDGVIDQLSGFNVVGVMTATSFTGNLTGDVTGNLTGNVNHTSNLLLQIGGSEKFRVGPQGQLGIGGANYGTSGQVLQSAGSGAPPTWNTINADKITEGNTEAEVVDTGSDGHFKVTTEGNERFRIKSNGQIGVGNFSSKLTHITDPLNVDSGIGTCNIGGNYIHLKRYSGGNTQYINAPQNNANLHISADDFIAFGVDHSSSMYSMGTEVLRIKNDGNIVHSSTTALQIAKGTTAQRPSGVDGMIRFNTTLSQTEEYRDSGWFSLSNKSSVTGGNTSTSGGYTIHTFTSSGTLVVSGQAKTGVDYLLVAGGGGGGNSRAGGGGGGGMTVTTGATIQPGSYTITVGAGGAGGTTGGGAGNTGVPGTTGSNTSFGSLASVTGGGAGGGGGSASDRQGRNGGSGGGGSDGFGGGSGTSGQGNSGGGSTGSTGGGGGGGKGGQGNQAPGDQDVGGAGGAAGASNLSGSTVNYSGGGGGGSRDNAAGGNGGGGGAGNGGRTTGDHATAGSANQGGGGGGGGRHHSGDSASFYGANGGSGIVIIRYLT